MLESGNVGKSPLKVGMMNRIADTDTKKYMKIHEAAKWGNVEAIVKLASFGTPDTQEKGAPVMDLDEVDRNGDTALHISIKKQRLEAAVCLLSVGVSITIRDCNGKTPLDLLDEELKSDSLEETYRESLEYLRNRLLEKTREIETSSEKMTQEQMRRAKLLLSAMPVADHPSHFKSEPELAPAATPSPIKSLPVVESSDPSATPVKPAIVKKSAVRTPANSVTQSNTISLHEAAKWGYIDAIVKLSSFGTPYSQDKSAAVVDLDELDRNGDAPIHIAISRNKFDAAITLINVGASVDIPNGLGKTPLMMIEDFQNNDSVKKSSHHLLEPLFDKISSKVIEIRNSEDKLTEEQRVRNKVLHRAAAKPRVVSNAVVANEVETEIARNEMETMVLDIENALTEKDNILKERLEKEKRKEHDATLVVSDETIKQGTSVSEKPIVSSPTSITYNNSASKSFQSSVEVRSVKSPVSSSGKTKLSSSILSYHEEEILNGIFRCCSKGLDTDLRDLLAALDSIIRSQVTSATELEDGIDEVVRERIANFISQGCGSYSKTALHIACEMALKSCIKILLDAGADGRAVDCFSRTPLFSCIDGDSLLLLGSAPRPSLISDLDFNHSSFLHYICRCKLSENQFNQILKAAIHLANKQSIDVDSLFCLQNVEGRNCLMEAAESNNAVAAKILLSGNDLNYTTILKMANAKDKSGSRSLDMALPPLRLSLYNAMEMIKKKDRQERQSQRSCNPRKQK